MGARRGHGRSGARKAARREARRGARRRLAREARRQRVTRMLARLGAAVAIATTVLATVLPGAERVQRVLRRDAAVAWSAERASPTGMPTRTAHPTEPDTARLAYAGRDRAGRPNYVRRAFTDDERRRLRVVFGIDDPARLTLPDSSDDAMLRYDARPAGCTGKCPRYPARVGLASVR